MWERAPRRAAATQCTRPRGRDGREAARAESSAQDAVFLVRDAGSLSVSQGPCLLGLVDVPTRGMVGGQGIGVGGRPPSVPCAPVSEAWVSGEAEDPLASFPCCTFGKPVFWLLLERPAASLCG